jgi:hypothetical protein
MGPPVASSGKKQASIQSFLSGAFHRKPVKRFMHSPFETYDDVNQTIFE